MNKNTRRLKKLNKKSLKTGQKNIISQNTSRNMQMRVYWNTGVGSGTVTVHEPIDKNKPYKPYKKGPQEWSSS